jgi:NhaA family Na+:H+ antiporter
VTAIAWANSPFDEQYSDLFGTHITFDAAIFRIDEDLRHWINDALMSLFFFVVGLEIKRELLRGELRGIRRAALPGIAALGGMIVPALIYTAFNAGGAGAKGWGIPMATDIAFALGVLALLGRRIPAQLRVFLLALAIVDDIGAIAVIALFYSGDIQVDSLVLALGLLALTFSMYRLGVQSIPVYFVIGAFVWLAVYESGIHATIAGVALGLMTPLSATKTTVGERFGRLARRLRGTEKSEALDGGSASEDSELETGPLYRLEHMLHPLSSFVIVPLFALANAGLSLDPDAIRASLDAPVTWGVAMGLLVGKPLGITVFAWLAVRLGVASLPQGISWAQMLGVGIVAGVGFTVALFVNELAFDSRLLVADGKIGILAASLAAGLVGYLYLRAVSNDSD